MLAPASGGAGAAPAGGGGAGGPRPGRRAGIGSARREVVTAGAAGAARGEAEGDERGRDPGQTVVHDPRLGATAVPDPPTMVSNGWRRSGRGSTIHGHRWPKML